MLTRALFCFAMVAALAPAPASAAGTTPLALVQQFDSTGQPLAGCLLYFYQAGTVATLQQIYQDFGLTIPAPNPLQCDQAARVPQHWLADGLIHVRLTSAAGVVQVDSTLQTLGPSSGPGPGGPTVDTTGIAATGDVKFRMTNENLLPYWIVLNGTTIGSPNSGASQCCGVSAPVSAQNLFTYLWANCPDAHCPVSGGRTTAAADYAADKRITVPDLRGRALVGLDCMQSTCAGRLVATNVTSGGGDTVNTPGASGGQSRQKASTQLTQGNLPDLTFGVDGISLNDPGHAHTGGVTSTGFFGSPGGNTNLVFWSTVNTGGNQTGISINATNTATNNAGGYQGLAHSGGGGSAANSAFFDAMMPYQLVTWYMKL